MLKIGIIQGNLIQTASLVVLAFFSSLSPLHAGTGHYEMSGSWPTGVRTHVHPMRPESEELCKAFELNLNKFAPLDAPLKCGSLIHNSSNELQIPKWEVLDPIANIEFIDSLQKIRAYQHELRALSDPKYREIRLKRMKEGSYQLWRARIPIWEGGVEGDIYRIQHRECDPESRISASVKYYLAKDSSNKAFDKLYGLGLPVELFVYEGKPYFISHSMRAFNDTFTKKLESEQPVIFVHKLYRSRSFVPVCRMLYIK